MSGVTAYLILVAVFTAGLAVYYVFEIRKWLKIRREEAGARERQALQVAAGLKGGPEPLLSGEEAARLFAGLHEATTKSNGVRP